MDEDVEAYATFLAVRVVQLSCRESYTSRVVARLQLRVCRLHHDALNDTGLECVNRDRKLRTRRAISNKWIQERLPSHCSRSDDLHDERSNNITSQPRAARQDTIVNRKEPASRFSLSSDLRTRHASPATAPASRPQAPPSSVRPTPPRPPRAAPSSSPPTAPCSPLGPTPARAQSR